MRWKVWAWSGYPQRAQAYRTDRFTGWLDDQPRLALEDLSSLVRITPVQ